MQKFLPVEQCPTCESNIRRHNPEWLKHTRETAGVSQEALAGYLKVSGPYLSQIEAGKRGGNKAIMQAYEELAETETLPVN